MNQFSQGEGSSGLSAHPLKRGRGRPRKDPSLKKTQATPAPPGFEGVKQNIPQRVNRTDGVDTMVGQPVSGVVEATFDAGYLLKVRIGNSTVTLRGVVFKPGAYAPVTAENDIAPHLPMIRRNDVHVPPVNQTWSRSQKLAVRTGALVKRKYRRTPKASPSVPPVGVRGTLVPVVLQPVNLQNGLQNSNQTPSDTMRTGHMMAFGDKDVHVVEPLSMLPPDRPIPVGQIFLGSQPPPPINQVSQGTKKNESEPFVKRDGANQVASKEHDNLGSSETSETQTDSGKEVPKSSAEDSGIVSKQNRKNVDEPSSNKSVQSASVAKPFFNYGTGRMTELLQAVQENMKENKVQVAEQQSSGVKVEAGERRTAEPVRKSKGSNA